MTEQLSTVYEPVSIEATAIEIWNKGNYFHAKAGAETSENSYTIVIPPPNVTAALHLGHALNNTLQDILIRFRRMQGFNTLWMPGTDHAGIATQTIVDKRLRHDGKPSLVDYRKTEAEGGNGRQEFIQHVQDWKDEFEARIIGQLKSMGCSCDWERTRFTMDDMCAKAVRANFFKLFSDGLIYRGKRLVNWDPATQTVLADDEVEHENVQGFFWYLQYPLIEPVEIDGKTIDTVTVATTRPETMLGDTAVAMNPSDPRAVALVGKQIRLPIVGRLITIIADEHVVMPDPEGDEKAKFSTGFLKVTPAHDLDDWAIGQRHDLDVINIMAPDGSISDKHGWEDADAPEAQNLLGMDRFEAREAIVEWFRQEKLLEEIRDYTHEVGHSYRSHVPIEPYLSDQWYVAVKKAIPHLIEKFGEGMIEGTDVPVNSLAGIALKPLNDGKLKFTPERYASTYKNWLENLRDWPISRQLWWGHQIPVWSATVHLNQFCPPSEMDPKVFYKQAQREFAKAFDRMSEDAEIKNGFAYQFKEDDPAWVYICPKNEKADNFFLRFKEFRDSLFANGSQPGEDLPIMQLKFEEYPTATERASNIYNKIDIHERDGDVLDTWFSSALWPFSTLGWPDDVPEMKSFYPGDVLCTAREIITLWVSRMVMMGQYCVGDIPFKDVYIHAMIQDGKGRKMSKSLGNGIDPLVAIDSHGADAMRFTLASMTTDTQDVRMPVAPMVLPDGRTVNTSPKFDVGRNFCNKLWNASRFAMMNLEGIEPDKFDASKMNISDKWILSRLASTIKETTGLLDEFKFNEPLNAVYKFFWNDLCDWYLEWAKPRMQDDEQKPIAQNVLAYVLDQTLRLLHPFIPFITEGMFQKLNELAPVRKLNGIADSGAAEAIIIAKWPVGIDTHICEKTEADITLTQNTIKAIREIRSQYNIAPKVRLKASAKTSAILAAILSDNNDLICCMAGLEDFAVGEEMDKPSKAASAIIDEIQIFVHDVIDPEAERKRLEKQKEQIVKGLRGTEGKLNNENFVSRAKPEVVEQAKAKLKEFQDQLAAIEKHISEIEE